MYKLILLLHVLLWAQGYLPAQSHSLPFYIDQSIKNSPLLKDYQLQIAASGIDSQLIRRAHGPQVGLNAQVYYAPSYKGYGYDDAVTNGGNYQAQVLASQQLIIRRSKRVQQEGLNIQNQYLDNSSKITQLDLTKAVTDQYIAAYRDLVLIKSVREVMTLLDNEAEILKPLVERGIYAQTDFLNIKLLKEGQAVTLKQYELQYQNDIYTLHIICGLDDTSVTELEKPTVTLSAKIESDNLLLLKQYGIDSLKFMNQRKLVDLNYQPKLGAFADAGLWTSNNPGFYKNFGAGVGLNFSMPLYDGGQRKYQYQKITLASQISKNYLSFYRRQYHQQILQLEAQLKSTDELIAQTQKQIDLSKDLIDVYKSELNRGLVKVTDMILTVNNYINYKNSITQTNMSRLQIINQLNYFK